MHAPGGGRPFAGDDPVEHVLKRRNRESRDGDLRMLDGRNQIVEVVRILEVVTVLSRQILASR